MGSVLYSGRRVFCFPLVKDRCRFHAYVAERRATIASVDARLRKRRISDTFIVAELSTHMPCYPPGASIDLCRRSRDCGPRVADLWLGSGVGFAAADELDSPK